eukprot:TRINITY_DN56102_c0_g1_i1.p1 TRINITY_DN56102_c0_g1~~TRINITY_DN56102_c0_g1_i1.p1  ORF type:complete len:414 (+),score=151.32 TRINITY_DN56102_c0_g1_i1:105-1346(+)
MSDYDSDYSDDVYSDNFDEPSPQKSADGRTQGRSDAGSPRRAEGGGAAPSPAPAPAGASPSKSPQPPHSPHGGGAAAGPSPGPSPAKGALQAPGRKQAKGKQVVVQAASPGGGEQEVATAEELETIRGLRRANEQLREQLLGLSRQLDDALNRRGEKVGQMARMRARQFDSPEAVQLMRENEKLRKRNQRMQEQLRASEDAERCVELQNIIAERERAADELREEHRSLENVSHNQARRLELVLQAEAELDGARNAHLEEMRRLKDRIQGVKAAKEADEKLMRQQQATLNALQDKIRACEGAKGKMGPASCGDLQRRLEERDHQVDALRYQILLLSKSNDGDRRRAQHQAKAQNREIRQLEADIKELRSRAFAQGKDASSIPAAKRREVDAEAAPRLAAHGEVPARARRTSLGR